jgi:hypothetical protein
VRYLIAVAAALLLLTACSSSGGSGSPSTSEAGTAQLCADAAALRSSLASLKNIDILAVGGNGVSSALADVQAKASALASHKSSFQPQIDALKSAITQLTNTLQDLPTGSIATKATTIGSQLAAVGVAGQSLASAVTTACPSGAAGAS